MDPATTPNSSARPSSEKEWFDALIGAIIAFAGTWELHRNPIPTAKLIIGTGFITHVAASLFFLISNWKASPASRVQIGYAVALPIAGLLLIYPLFAAGYVMSGHGAPSGIKAISLLFLLLSISVPILSKCLDAYLQTPSSPPMRERYFKYVAGPRLGVILAILIGVVLREFSSGY